jgi:ATP-dependent protease ClpP protease subunit
MDQPLPPVPPSHVVLSYVGPINYPATKILRNSCCGAVNGGAKQLTILFSSFGGATFEGFALYHFLRALPIELTMHNIGSVQSIANVVFMAGFKRLACTPSRFMFHDFSWGSSQAENLERNQIKERTESLEADAENFITIFKSNTSLTDKDFETLQLLNKPSIITADRAKEVGIIHEIADAKIPAGIPIYNVDF